MDLLWHPNEQALWYTLLQEAQQDARVYLSGPIENYLVSLLIRFSTEPDLAHSLLGLEFLKAPHPIHPLRTLQRVGDKCLLLSGLFREHAQKRSISVDYLTELGKSAYQLLLQKTSDNTALFQELYEEFRHLITVLAATRQYTVQNPLDILPPAAIISTKKH